MSMHMTRRDRRQLEVDSGERYTMLSVPMLILPPGNSIFFAPAISPGTAGESGVNLPVLTWMHSHFRTDIAFITS